MWTIVTVARRCFAGLGIVTVLILITSPATADGKVLRAAGCGNKIFASGDRGASMLEGTSSEKVTEGDTLSGDVDTIGHVILFNKTTGEAFPVIVQERALSQGDLALRITAACRPSPNAVTSTSGIVMRATGCGTKLFVNTPKGYAVLDRLAGGNMVSKGDHLTGDFNKPGRVVVVDSERHVSVTAFVDDYLLSSSALAAKMAIRCRGAPKEPYLPTVPNLAAPTR